MITYPSVRTLSHSKYEKLSAFASLTNNKRALRLANLKNDA